MAKNKAAKVKGAKPGGHKATRADDQHAQVRSRCDLARRIGAGRALWRPAARLEGDAGPAGRVQRLISSPRAS